MYLSFILWEGLFTQKSSSVTISANSGEMDILNPSKALGLTLRFSSICCWRLLRVDEHKPWGWKFDVMITYK